MIDRGDLMLYGSSGLVLFYDAVDGYSYTRIGRLTSTDGLAKAVGMMPYMDHVVCEICYTVPHECKGKSIGIGCRGFSVACRTVSGTTA